MWNVAPIQSRAPSQLSSDVATPLIGALRINYLCVVNGGGSPHPEIPSQHWKWVPVKTFLVQRIFRNSNVSFEVNRSSRFFGIRLSVGRTCSVTFTC